MPHFEYKVVPAPTRAEKARGVKTPEGRFARTIETELNRMGEAGWEYLRAELLPQDERSGLASTQTKWRTVLIFRRLQDTEAEAMHARVIETPVADALAADPMPAVLPPAVGDAEDDTDPPVAAEPNVVPLKRDDDGGDDTPKG